MNVKKAYENFKILKDSVEKDGRIDTFEIDVLLDYLEFYFKRSKRKEILRLKSVLNDAKEKGGVSNDDSVPIIEALYDVLLYLKRENTLERNLGYLFAFIGLGVLFYYMFYF